jgi:hypothetical protein
MSSPLYHETRVEECDRFPHRPSCLLLLFEGSSMHGTLRQCSLRFWLLLPLLVLLPATQTGLLASSGASSVRAVSFSRDVLPILSENCFRCQGPDEKARKAKLRLDTRETALRVLMPGKSADSELIRRVTATDDEVMPPPQTKRRLTTEQKELLRRWVDQGAPWGKHWAYETAVRPALPAVKNLAWPQNPIDDFVLARLEKEGLTPSAEAVRDTLIRRLFLDLTGLPPTLPELDVYLADQTPDAYEKLVGRLLSSQRFGERMALDWLDVGSSMSAVARDCSVPGSKSAFPAAPSLAWNASRLLPPRRLRAWTESLPSTCRPKIRRWNPDRSIASSTATCLNIWSHLTKF